MFKTRLKSRKSPSVDMAAMCDIAFLILVFFIASSKFKPNEPLTINPPGFSKFISDPDEEAATILIADGKVMLKIPDSAIRVQTLAKMGVIAHLPFSSADRAKFAIIEVVGVPMSQLKQYISGYYNHQAFNMQQGIPVDAANHELANWIYWSRVTYKLAYQRSLYFEIKADEKVEYPLIKRVIAVLQSQNINKFSLVTSSKVTKI